MPADLARLAYEASFADTDPANYTPWDDLPDEGKALWDRVVQAVVGATHTLEDVLTGFSTQEGSPYLRLPGFVQRFPQYAKELREKAEELSVEAHNRLAATPAHEPAKEG